MDMLIFLNYNRCMLKTFFVRCFTLIIISITMFSGAGAVRAEGTLAQKLLNYRPPTLPVRKPRPPETSEMKEAELSKYQKIFTLQQNAQWNAADRIIHTLKDRRLMGYVLQQRYLHPTGYSSTYEELRDWMRSYADHGDAIRVYRLATRKKGDVEDDLPVPKVWPVTHRYIDLNKKPRWLYSDGTRRSLAQREAFIKLSKEIGGKIKNERPTESLRLLEAERGALTNLDYNRLKARIAASYMHEGKITKAFNLAKQAVENAGPKVPLAAWVAGLSAWRKDRHGEAAKFFEIAASSPYANAWTKSGGAFWASRAHMRVGNFQAVSLWLNLAAAEPRTFYGLIAVRALSRPLNFDWSVPPLGVMQKQKLTKNEAAVRGLALLALKKYELAAHEFKHLEQSESFELRRALITVAEDLKTPGMAWRAASYLIKEEQGDVPLAAQYPVMRWHGGREYRVESALLHALIRQESKFNPRAGNPSGASGLMQLMPSTAQGIMGGAAYETAGGQSALFTPSVNIAAGQKYIHELFKSYVPDRNLFDLLIAWNAGPGNLKRWKKNLKNIDDPLLFIETIPVAETRAFVERVMTNYWIYQNRFGYKTPSLDAVAEGKMPIYEDVR